MATTLKEAFYGFDNYPSSADLAKAAKKFQGFTPLQILDAAKEEINTVGGNDAINVIFYMCKSHIAAAFHKYYLGPDKEKGIKKAKDASGDNGPEAAYIQSIIVMLKSKKANPILAWDSEMYDVDDDPLSVMIPPSKVPYNSDTYKQWLKQKDKNSSYELYLYKKWLRTLPDADQRFMAIAHESTSYDAILSGLSAAYPEAGVTEDQVDKHLDTLKASFKKIKEKDFWEKLGFYIMRYAQSDVFKGIRKERKPDTGQMSLDAPVGEDGQGTDVAAVDPAQGTFNVTEDMKDWIDSLPTKTAVQQRDKTIMTLKFMGYSNDKIIRGMTKNGLFASEETGRVLLSQRLKILSQEFYDYYSE
jgi:hypothetical protein